MILMDPSSTSVPDHHRHHHGEPVQISGPCPLPSQNNDVTAGPDLPEITTTEQLIHIRVSGTDIRPKEVVLVSLALLLLVFSVALFFKHWRKNYWDINQLPYYAYLYKTDDSLLLTPAPVLESALPCDEANIEGGMSPSHSFFGQGRGGSCQSSLRLDKTGFSRESRSSLRLDSKPSSFVCRRHSSTTRRGPKRSSFVHVTAEAMQKLSLNRMNSVSQTGFHHRRQQVMNGPQSLDTCHSPPWGAMSSTEPKLRRCQSGVDRRSRLHGANGQMGMTGGPRWTTSKRRYRKSSLNDMSDFESTETTDDVCRQSIALREMRHGTSSNEYRVTSHEHRLISHGIERHRTTSNDDAAVIERDEDEILQDTTQHEFQMVVASPPQTMTPFPVSPVTPFPVFTKNTVTSFPVHCHSTSIPVAGQQTVTSFPLSSHSNVTSLNVTSLPVEEDHISVHSSPEMKCQKYTNNLTNEFYTCI